jgi:hypothetical protein
MAHRLSFRRIFDMCDLNSLGIDLSQGRPRCYLLVIAVVVFPTTRHLVATYWTTKLGGLFSKAVKMPGRPWTEGEVKRANAMRVAGYSYGTIDKALRRPAGATQRRLEFAGYGSKDHVKSFRAPDYLVAERDALASARERRALTGYFCGDPPPGYSALHGKTGLR